MGYMVTLSGFLTLSIPLLGLFYIVSRYIRPYQIRGPIRKKLTYVWFAALCFTGYGIIDTITDHRSSNRDFSFQNYDVQGDTIVFNVTDPLGFYQGWYHIGAMRYTGDEMYNDFYSLNINKAESDQLRIERTVTSSGSSAKNALKHAKQVDHEISFNGTEVKIPSQASLQRGEKIRDQYIHYDIYVPEGKEVVFDSRTKGRRFMMDFDDNVEVPRNFHKYSWTMGKSGFVSKKWEQLSDFQRSVKLDNPLNINVNGDFEIDLVSGKENELVLVGHKLEVEKLSIIQQDDILTIVNEKGKLEYPIKVYIRTPEIKTLSSRSDEKIRLEGFTQENMEILLTGEANLDAYINVGHLILRSDKNNEINLTGKGQSLHLGIGYYSDFNAENYPVEELILDSQLRGGKFRVAKKIKTDRRLHTGYKIFGDPVIQIGEESEVVGQQ
jgi:hypothetical protein